MQWQVGSVKTNPVKPVAIILRGLPGSGKSRLARQLWQQHAPQCRAEEIICSTDDYFQRGVSYQFDASKLPMYHALNLVRFVEGLKAGRPLMICDNTNMACWEYLPYQTIASAMGYGVRRLLIGDPKDIHQQKLCARNNLHDICLTTIQAMAARFEADQDKPFNPW